MNILQIIRAREGGWPWIIFNLTDVGDSISYEAVTYQDPVLLTQVN